VKWGEIQALGIFDGREFRAYRVAAGRRKRL
jgi:hypothetical protein